MEDTAKELCHKYWHYYHHPLKPCCAVKSFDCIWGLQGSSDPEKVFDRTANLESTQIISYRVDPAEKWCVLIGIAQGAPERYARAPPSSSALLQPQGFCIVRANLQFVVCCYVGACAAST